MISEQQVDAALQYLRESVEDASKAKHDVVVCEQWIKVTRAKLMAENLGSSMAQAEAKALADPRFAQAVEAYGAAVQLFEFHKMKRETAQAWIEAWRTQSSNQRAEGKAY